MSITCGECGVFEENGCSLKTRDTVGSCSLYPEVPTILGRDHNPKCTRGRPRNGNAGMLASWGYAEIPTSGNASYEKESIDLVSDSPHLEEEASCVQCFFLKEDGCKVFPKNKDWSYAQKCRSFGRRDNGKGGLCEKN